MYSIRMTNGLFLSNTFSRKTMTFHNRYPMEIFRLKKQNYRYDIICAVPLFVRYEPRSEKTGIRGFRAGPTQTGLYNHTRWLEA